jgi:hypothetical protein
MRYYLFLFFIFCARLNAATFELNVAELFPQQNLIQTFQINAEGLQAEMTLNDGQIIDILDAGMTDRDLSDITEIFVSGPDVVFKVITKSGSEWTRSLSTLNLRIIHRIKDGRRVMALDIDATPAYQIFEEGQSPNTNIDEESHSVLNFGHFLLKTLMVFVEGNIHLTWEASANLADNSYPAMKFELEMGKQSLAYELNDFQDGSKVGAWKIQGNGFGKGSLINIVFTALKMMSQECKKMSAETPYDHILQTVFYGVDLFLTITAPIAEWEGITLINEGSLAYTPHQADDFAVDLHNLFKLEAYDGNWNTSLGSKSHIAIVENLPEWSQEFIIKNPVHDLEKIAQWIQLNWTDQLSTLLNMPSIRYYGVYFPSYFIQGLTMIMMNVGEFREDGTLSIVITSNPAGTYTLGDMSPSEVAALIIAKIKWLIGGWWG